MAGSSPSSPSGAGSLQEDLRQSASAKINACPHGRRKRRCRPAHPRYNAADRGRTSFPGKTPLMRGDGAASAWRSMLAQLQRFSLISIIYQRSLSCSLLFDISFASPPAASPPAPARPPFGQRPPGAAASDCSSAQPVCSFTAPEAAPRLMRLRMRSCVRRQGADRLCPGGEA